MSFTQKFYTADLHLGPHGILLHCPDIRRSHSNEDMDAEIVRRSTSPSRRLTSSKSSATSCSPAMTNISAIFSTRFEVARFANI